MRGVGVFACAVLGRWPGEGVGRAGIGVKPVGFHLRRSLRDGDIGEFDGPISDGLRGFGPRRRGGGRLEAMAEGGLPVGWAWGIPAPAALPNGNAAGGLGLQC